MSMIPSKNAMIRAANSLSLHAEESELAAAQMRVLHLELKAQAYDNQRHDFLQVIQFLTEHAKNLGAAPKRKIRNRLTP